MIIFPFEGGGGRGKETYLILTVQIKVLFRFEGVGVWVFGHGFDALSDVGEDFLGAKHPVGVEAGVTGGSH